MSRSAVALARLAAPRNVPASDAHLLRTFITARTEDAFAELVRRHGPMVLAVCRRVLSDDDDAEDAFQAVFLVLARKAATLRGSNVAGWLYGVAVRTARGVRVMRDRRRKYERASRGRQPAEPTLNVDLDTARIIDEELAKLPEHLRGAVVLCELRGLSRQRAAAELGVPEGTLSSRLAAAKRKLAARLAARGLASVALTAVIEPATVSATLLESTAIAVRGAAGSVAMCAASAVMKGMLFDQLRTIVLMTAVCLTVVYGGLAMTGAAPDAPPEKAADDPAAALVKRLGSAVFADRETAQKELRKLGAKAEAAIRVGLMGDEPEVRARCAQVLAEIHRDALDAFAKAFDPAVENRSDHPIWMRYKAIAGDTRASRELFARIIKNANWLRRLDAAEAGPEAAARQYREAVLDVGGHYRKAASGFDEHYRRFQSLDFFIPLWPCDTADEVAYLLLLGCHPGTTDARPPKSAEAQLHLYSDGESQLYYKRGLVLGLLGKELVPGPAGQYNDSAALTPGTDRVFDLLLAAWLPNRTDPAALQNGFRLAVETGAGGVLPFARKLAAGTPPPGPAHPMPVRIAALAAVARFGTPADLPQFEALFADGTLFHNFTWDAKPVRTGTVQVRDCALGLALLLYREYPGKHGFALANDEVQPGKRPDVARYGSTAFGFFTGDDDLRAAAHAKVKAFLAERKQEPKREDPPAKGAKVWPHFAKVVGDDKGGRALFDLIVSNPKALELLERAQTGERDVLKRYRTRCDELNALLWKYNEEALQYAAAPPAPRRGVVFPDEKPADPPGGVPVVETAGWLLLGTYPATRGDEDGPRLDFLDLTLGQRHLSEALDKGPLAQPLRKLVGAWLASRGDEPRAVSIGLSLAQQFDIPAALPVARRRLEKYDGKTGTWTAALIGVQAIQVVGKYGTKDDVPLLARFASDATVAVHIVPDKGLVKPGTVAPVDGRDSTEEVRDAALAMMIALQGGEPCPMRFRSQADREATHKKARAWLAEQKK